MSDVETGNICYSSKDRKPINTSQGLLTPYLTVNLLFAPSGKGFVPSEIEYVFSLNKSSKQSNLVRTTHIAPFSDKNKESKKEELYSSIQSNFAHPKDAELKKGFFFSLEEIAVIFGPVLKESYDYLDARVE